MDYWLILGIEPTKNIRKIKKQYASRLKNCHPEDHPDEFMELEKAYHAAIEYTKTSYLFINDAKAEATENSNGEEYKNSLIKNPLSDNTDEFGRQQRRRADELFKDNIFSDEMSYNQQLLQSKDIQSFMHDFNLQYDNYIYIDDANTFWSDILFSEKCQNLIKNPIFLELLIGFFNKNDRVLTKAVIGKVLLPFFQSLTKYNYGEKQKLLSDFIDKLDMMEEKFQKSQNVSLVKDTHNGTTFNVVLVLFIIIYILLRFTPFNREKIETDEGYYEQIDKQNNKATNELVQRYKRTFVEAGLITPNEEIIGSQKIENHNYKNEVSLIYARMIYFAVSKNAKYEVIKPVFYDIAESKSFDDKYYLKSIIYNDYYNQLVSVWKADKNTHKQFYEDLFNFFDG